MTNDPIPPTNLHPVKPGALRYDLIPQGWEPASAYTGFPWRPPGTDSIIFDYDAVQRAARRIPMKWIPGLAIASYVALAAACDVYGTVSDPMHVLAETYGGRSLPPKRARLVIWVLETGGVMQRKDGE